MENFGVILNLIIGIGFVAVVVVANGLLGPKPAKTQIKQEPFECGSDLIQDNNRRVAVKFYLLAILFVLFDVDVVLLYPWASVVREVGIVGYIEGITFLFVLLVGLIYCWKKGALEWK